MDIQSLSKKVPVEGEYSLEGLDFIVNGDQYLQFTLGDDFYALDILCVEEIRTWTRPTLIPNAPEYVKGVINMRGVIVPIIDLRIKFNFSDVTYKKTTVIIVLTVDVEDGSRTIGFVVDSVSDVLNATEHQIKQAPPFGSSIPQHYISGLVNIDNDVITLLDVVALQVLEPHEPL